MLSDLWITYNFQLYNLSNGRSRWRYERSEFFIVRKLYQNPVLNKGGYLAKKQDKIVVIY